MPPQNPVVWKHHDYRKQQRELEDRTSDLYADDVVKLKR